ncbi:2-keto-4-pentenoate hydratase [Planomonospora venezuelensis]|uniref:2-oxo-3-hexenedioate decarboxylase n=1 Tax=Planomonospora venezuelensis TaxID=1999 RepID=A0A841D1N7_PLAVE|nr:2-oxo-3-hexenedioate decarboxylase [Planomonospora venezuelensis]GIN01448.1 4-oxalocrotonate decarboxylase [Planomonospora venezuelensis]
MTLDVRKLAGILDEAARTARAVPQPEQDYDVDTAYRVQEELLRLRLERGDRLSGVKLGFTSEGKRRQMGVRDLILGRVTAASAVPDGATIPVTGYIHPRVEPEVVYLIGRRIASVADAFAPDAVAAVAPGIEIIDSRYEDFRFSLPDVVADNTSAAGYAVGPWQPYDPARWNLGVVLEIDGRPVQVGSTAAILGDPRRAVAEAARLAVRAGTVLEPGWVLLAGAATPAEPLAPGAHVSVEIRHLGRVSFGTEPAGAAGGEAGS